MGLELSLAHNNLGQSRTHSSSGELSWLSHAVVSTSCCPLWVPVYPSVKLEVQLNWSLNLNPSNYFSSKVVTHFQLTVLQGFPLLCSQWKGGFAPALPALHSGATFLISALCFLHFCHTELASSPFLFCGLHQALWLKSCWVASAHVTYQSHAELLCFWELVFPQLAVTLAFLDFFNAMSHHLLERK